MTNGAQPSRTVFRFLDLAPELRNSIYEYSLTHDIENGQKSSAQLLRVCRQLYTEARDILYAESAISVTAVFSPSTTLTPSANLPDIEHCKLSITGDVQHTLEDAHDFGLVELLHIWPQHLLRIPRLSLQVQIESNGHIGHWHMNELRPLNHFFYQLASFLDTEDRCSHQSIHIGFSGVPVLRSALSEKVIFWPILKMAEFTTLEISGHDILERRNNGTLLQAGDQVPSFGLRRPKVLGDSIKELERNAKDDQKSRIKIQWLLGILDSASRSLRDYKNVMEWQMSGFYWAIDQVMQDALSETSLLEETDWDVEMERALESVKLLM